MLVVMTGLAAAGDENLYVEPGPKTIPYCPDSVTYDVRVYDILNLTADHCIKATIRDSDRYTHLMFKFTNETGATSGWIESGVYWNWGKPNSGNDENLSLEVCANSSAPQNTGYLFEVFDTGGTIFAGPETASGTTMGTTIPEFATIAIPVAAILGLVLFYNYRKRKEE